MSKVLFPLALANLRKNYRLYGPFALAFVTSVALLYNFITLAFNPSLSSLRGGPSIVTVLALGMIILAITGAAIIWYANGFVFKQRTKEYGLYGILGLERRHLLSLMWIEITVFSGLSALVGIASGVLVNRLILALYQRIMDLSLELDTKFQPQYLWTCLTLILLLYLSLIVINSWRIFRLKPLQLVRESRRGEKKGRFTWLSALVGLGLMGYGYYLALSIENALAAIMVFFLAVLLVTAGTYLLFQAGSITLLKFLKGRKSYYYKPENFISTSNLIFRMRKNGVGLATICLLSTMALVTLSAGISLFLGTESAINRFYPTDYSLSLNYSYQLPRVDASKTLEEQLSQFGQKYQLDLVDMDHTHYIQVIGKFHGHDFTGQEVHVDSETGMVKHDNPDKESATLNIISLADYNHLSGQNYQLAANQVLWFDNQASASDRKNQEIQVAGQNFQIQEHLTSNLLETKAPDFTMNFVDHRTLLVVSDLSVIQDKLAGTNFISRYTVYANSQASHDQQLASAEHLEEVLKTVHVDEGIPVNASFLVKAEIRDSYMQMIGSIFFIGIFLAAIFLLGLALTIYYKQISEGLEDADRFEILQKVGLTKQAIHKTIRKQITVVFFAPIILALFHLAGAYHMMSLILRLISAMRLEDILLPTIGTALAITLFYFLVFLITSRSYEKIVSSKS